MIGQVVVMEPSEYQDVAERRRAGRIARRRPARSCSRIWRATPAIAPTRRAAGRCSRGCSARPCSSQNGETVVVDEAYLRESILKPAAKIAAGFQPIMPTFQGLVTEEQLLELIEYVKSLQALPAGTATVEHDHADAFSCRRSTT